MNRSRRLRGHRSLRLGTSIYGGGKTGKGIYNRYKTGKGILNRYNQTWRYSDASVRVGKAHPPHLPLKRGWCGTLPYNSTTHNTLTYKDWEAQDLPNPHIRHNHTHKDEGAKALPNPHELHTQHKDGGAQALPNPHIRHTHTHKEEGAKALPSPHELQTQSRGWLNKQHELSPTGVLNTNVPTNTHAHTERKSKTPSPEVLTHHTPTNHTRGKWESKTPPFRVSHTHYTLTHRDGDTKRLPSPQGTCLQTDQPQVQMTPSPTGVLDTYPASLIKKPWFRQIRPGSSRTDDRCSKPRSGSQIWVERQKEDQVSRKWKRDLQEPTPPNLATFVVEHLSDIPTALRELERQTYPSFLLYQVNLASAPYPEIEIEEYNRHMRRASWDQEEAILVRRVEQTLYDFLSNDFRNFAPAQYTFNRHRRDHPLCLSRVWFSLLDTFIPQVDEQGLWTTPRVSHPLGSRDLPE